MVEDRPLVIIWKVDKKGESAMSQTKSASMFGSTEPTKGCVLLVEDDAKVRRGIRETLENDGYAVIEAEDAQKGIELINAGENPLVVDTVITNIDMRKGMDAVAYFKEQYPSVPLIILTGLPDRSQTTQQRTRIAILGAGKGGSAFLDMFSHLPDVEIVGITDKYPTAPGLRRARDLGIPVMDDVVSLIAREDTHLILDVTGDSNMERLIADRKSPATEVLGGTAAKLLWTLVLHASQMEQQLLRSEKMAAMVKKGVTDYLIKPVVREKLLATVGAAMEMREIHRL